ncbi:MAG: phosphatidylserine decarboxylase family protein [Vicinamibacteria bacterium]|nr:phosphatidylserine decarboxylase family protein [Vicinamibacteria bacterium]
MKIAPEGLPFIAIAAGIALLSAYFSWRAFGVLLVLAVFVTAFFRDPARDVPQGAGLVVSPADGKVVLIVPTPPGHAAGEGATQISIFLSVFDVHINRAPIAGTITDVVYNKGEFLPAFDDKASLRNEQNRAFISGPEGRVGFTQIAGLIARRIVFRKKVGDVVTRGEQVGLIRFGSRTDVFLPKGSTLNVKVGDRVRGGSSVIAHLPAPVKVPAS